MLHNKLGAADAKQQAAIYQELTAAAAELGRRDTPAEPELAKLICLAAAGRNFTRVLERDVEISAARKRSAAQRARRKR